MTTINIEKVYSYFIRFQLQNWYLQLPLLNFLNNNKRFTIFHQRLSKVSFVTLNLAVIVVNTCYIIPFSRICRLSFSRILVCSNIWNLKHIGQHKTFQDPHNLWEGMEYIQVHEHFFHNLKNNFPTYIFEIGLFFYRKFYVQSRITTD